MTDTTSDGARVGDLWTARPRRSSRRGWAVVAAVIVSVVAATGTAVANDMRRYRHAWQDRALPGAVIQAVDLAGMDRTRALAAIEDALTPVLDRRVTLRFEDRTWTTSLRDLGATTDAEQVVDAAIGASRDVSWRTLAEVRWRGGQVPFEATVTVDQPRDAARQLVRAIADALHIAPVNAELSWNREWIWTTPHRVGRAVQFEPTAEALMAALRGEADTVAVVTEELRPEVTTAAYAQVLFLRQGQHRLDLYLDGRVAGSYRVAVGTGNYPTPTGVYHVSQKRYRPTWVNPSPNGWGRGMPRRIGPGPNNPLGLRALNWSAPGAIRFHGTANVDSLGRDASHGCVRLSNPDIVGLYGQVDVGAVIVSIR